VAWNGRDAQDEEKLEGRAMETLLAPSFIEDETGCLMTDPLGAQLELPAEYGKQISGASMSEGARHFLGRHRLSAVGDTTVSEYAIKSGDPLLVLGTLGQNRGLGSRADASGRVLRNAYLSREAADLQRRQKHEAVGVPQAESLELAQDDKHDVELNPGMVLCAGNNRQPFVLSQETPQNMIDASARTAIIDIWGGPVPTLASLGFLMKYLGAW
jgi:hypothetical protein